MHKLKKKKWLMQIEVKMVHEFLILSSYEFCNFANSYFLHMDFNWRILKGKDVMPRGTTLTCEHMSLSKWAWKYLLMEYYWQHRKNITWIFFATSFEYPLMDINGDIARWEWMFISSLNYFINSSLLLRSNNFKLIIKGWVFFSKNNDINEKYSFALHIHQQSQKKRLNTTQDFKGNAFFTCTHYNILVILENASHSKRDETLLA
jgi:hypothetical protein